MQARRLMKLLGLVAAVACVSGCVNVRPGVGIGGMWSHHNTSEHQFSRGAPGATIDTDPDDGWGLFGRFDAIGELPKKWAEKCKPLENVMIGARLNVSHTEVDNAEVVSVWPPHDHDDGHRSSQNTITRKSNVEVSYQVVSLGPLLGYDAGWIRPYIQGGPAAVFIEAGGDYYGAPSESDTTLGWTASLGAEVPIDDGLYLFAEGGWLWAEPSLYYIENSKFNLDLNTYSIGAGLGFRF